MDELVYRSPAFRVPVEKDVPSTEDERNYSTLKRVRELLAESIDELHRDFNAFNVLSAGSKKDATEKLLIDITARQIAYTILQPLLETIESSIQQIDNRYREK